MLTGKGIKLVSVTAISTSMTMASKEAILEFLDLIFPELQLVSCIYYLVQF